MMPANVKAAIASSAPPITHPGRWYRIQSRPFAFRPPAPAAWTRWHFVRPYTRCEPPNSNPKQLDRVQQGRAASLAGSAVNSHPLGRSSAADRDNKPEVLEA